MIDQDLPPPPLSRVLSSPTLELAQTVNLNEDKPTEDTLQSSITKALVLAAFCMFALHVYNASTKKDRLDEVLNDFAATILININAFSENEILHLFVAAGIYEHEPPLAYWYRMYIILAELARAPLFYYFLQKYVNEQMHNNFPKGADDEKQIFLILASYAFLSTISHLYSQLIEAKFLPNRYNITNAEPTPVINATRREIMPMYRSRSEPSPYVPNTPSQLQSRRLSEPSPGASDDELNILGHEVILESRTGTVSRRLFSPEGDA